MIVARSLSKQFANHRAVTDVSFVVEPGEAVGLIGPNGAGKSTTLRMLTGVILPDQGHLTICGHDGVKLGRFARAHVGFLPENTPLYPELSVRGFLRHAGSLAGLRGKRLAQRLAEVADACAVETVLRRPIGALSKGFRRRVGLAAALIHDPALLLMDEPTDGLDPTQVMELRGLLDRLTQGRSVLMSSHALDEVERTCDRVLVMARGRLLYDGTPDRLRSLGEPVLRVEVRQTGAEALATALRTLEHVLSVSTSDLGDGWSQLTIRPKPGAADLRQAIAEQVARQALVARELRTDRPPMDEVFAALITAAERIDRQTDGTST